VQLREIPRPTSPAARGALEVVTAFSSPALVNHCLRSYLWAASYGALHQIGFDAELLYVAAMLHDLGLEAEFDNVSLPFETAGGHIAWVYAAGAGWPAARRQRAAEIVVRHMADDVEPEVDAEGHLLAVATSLDISGRRPDAWPDELRREVVSELPRLDLGARFLRCFEDQARRKPESAAATSVGNGIAHRIATNPLDAHHPMSPRTI
jgi:hypothetical protein